MPKPEWSCQTLVRYLAPGTLEQFMALMPLLEFPVFRAGFDYQKGVAVVEVQPELQRLLEDALTRAGFH